MSEVRSADFPQIELPRAADRVVRALIDGIRAGSVAPGSRLPRDHELAARFGVSRPVVRDALDQLRRAGILEVRRGSGGGAFVRAIAIPHELLTHRPELGKEELRQLLEARRSVETSTCLLAAERADDDDLAALAELVDQLERSRADPLDFVELDIRFHLRAAAASRNAPLVRVLADLFRELQVARTRQTVVYGDMDGAVAAQRALLTALAAREPEGVLHALNAHLCRLERHVLGRAIALRRPAPVAYQD
jgi:GntR family transcriptional repressor for pyruvate dehydrogenase complex